MNGMVYNFEIVIVVVAVVAQLFIEFGSMSKRLQNFRYMTRLLYTQIIIEFFRGLPCFCYYKIIYTFFYIIFFFYCIMEWLFPYDSNASFIKKYEEIKKKREEKRIKVPESPLFLKTCDIGNKIFPRIVVALSVVVVIKIIVLVL